MRGLDQYLVAQGQPSISARGIALVDCGGGSADRPFERAQAFHKLGYRVAVLRDDDKKPTDGVEKSFTDAGGRVFSWRQDRALEDELFASLSDAAVGKMLDYAIELHGDSLIDDHIKSATGGKMNLEKVQGELLFGAPPAETRAALGKAARAKKAGWFKSVSWMEDGARNIVGRDLAAEGVDEGFATILADVFAWTDNG
jgi:hypothetical protein